MRRALPLLLVLAAVAGCGGSSDADDAASARTSTADAGATTATTAAPASATTAGRPSPFVVVTSLLGKPLPNEPGCAFAKEFVPDNRSATAYDGALTLSVRCPPSDGYTPTGQIVNREGSVPREITCRDSTRGQSFCVYVPSSTVGLYFTGTDRAVVRRRLEHLMEVVAALPTGITPLQAR